MIDWSKLLFDWRQATVPDSHNLTDWEEYNHDCAGRDHVVVTVGDSWTWGDSLPDRLDQVYGRLVSQQLGADWINIGGRGRSNSWVLKSLMYLSTLLPQHYSKTTVIVTLTENAREFETTYTFPHDYKQTFDTHGDTPEFYEALLSAARDFWIDQIQQVQQNLGTKIIVGNNFVWHDLNKLDAVKLESNWIELIGEHQQRAKPTRTNLVTGWIFDKVQVVSQMVPVSKSVYQTWALPYIDRANQVNAWLMGSDLNNKAMSKHPVPLGHKIWADYILTHINK